MHFTSHPHRTALLSFLLTLCLLFSGCQTSAPDLPQKPPPKGSSFSVHFLDVGQGDSALILCDGSAMLIDGGEADQSSKLYSFLTAKGITHLDYLVATHPHSDHIGGLSGALQVVRVDTALSPVTEHDSKQFASLTKYLSLQDVSLTVPKAGETFSLGSAEVAVLGPVEQDWAVLNDASLVLKITYGETSFLFTGDMEEAAEKALLEAGADLSADVLKVAHHGSSSSTCETFLAAVSPAHAVISVGEGNAYDHPATDVLARLEAAGAALWRTDLQGDLLCTSDGKTVSFSVEKQHTPAPEKPPVTESEQASPGESDAPEEEGTAAPGEADTPAAGETEEAGTPSEPAETTCIGNVKSKTFHSPSCVNLPAERNRIRLDSYQSAIDAGYSPCGGCLG